MSAPVGTICAWCAQAELSADPLVDFAMGAEFFQKVPDDEDDALQAAGFWLAPLHPGSTTRVWYPPWRCEVPEGTACPRCGATDRNPIGWYTSRANLSAWPEAIPRLLRPLEAAASFRTITASAEAIGDVDDWRERVVRARLAALEWGLGGPIPPELERGCRWLAGIDDDAIRLVLGLMVRRVGLSGPAAPWTAQPLPPGVPRCAGGPDGLGRVRPCPLAAAVLVVDVAGATMPGCEAHAADALDGIQGARIGKVFDWSVPPKLLALPWNRRAR